MLGSIQKGYNDARNWLINDAINSRIAVEKAQADNRLKVEQALADELRGKQELDRARTIADFLNKQAVERPADAPALSGRAAVQQQAMQGINDLLGLSAQQAREIKPEALQPMLQGNVDAVAKLYGQTARDNLAGRVLAARRGVYGATERNDWQGDVARAGAVTAAAGGAVAGGMALTEGAQQLIALMQYLQSGQQNEQAAEGSPLA